MTIINVTQGAFIGVTAPAIAAAVNVSQVAAIAVITFPKSLIYPPVVKLPCAINCLQLFDNRK